MQISVLLAIFLPYWVTCLQNHNNGAPLCDPASSQSKRIDFRAVFFASKWFYIDESTETFSVHGRFGLTWTDQNRCVWNVASQQYPQMSNQVDAIALDSQDIWTPSIILRNSVGEVDVVDTLGYGQTLTVYNEGTIQFWPSGRWQVHCKLESLRKWPFDTQTCHLTFEHRLSIDFANFTSSETLMYYDDLESQHWRIKDVSADTNRNCLYGTILGGNRTVCTSQARFYFKMKRQHQHYVTIIFLPCIGLVLVQLAALILPAHAPERTVFSLMVLFTFGIFENDVRREVPVSSEALLVQGFTAVNFMLGFVVTIYCSVFAAIADAAVNKRAATITELISLKETQLRQSRRADIIAFGVLSFVVLFIYIGIFVEMSRS